MQFDGDPAQYTAGSSVATVGVVFENRRRNLISGIVASNNGGKLHLDVYQAFGNCPKYVQGRLWLTSWWKHVQQHMHAQAQMWLCNQQLIIRS